MGEVHIRDMMNISKQDYKSGKVSTRTMCGLDDPQMNTLTFGDPDAVVHREVKYGCQKCRNRWISEVESDKQQKRAIGKFRKILHNTANLNRFKGKR